MNNRYLFQALELAPTAFARLLAVIPPERWDEQTDEDRFTLREAIAHLADWEPMLLCRVRASVETPGVTIEAFDEGQRAIDLGYSETDPFEEVERFADLRAETISYVEGISDWSGTIMHPEIGVLTTEDIVSTLIGHDTYHFEHLTQYLVD